MTPTKDFAQEKLLLAKGCDLSQVRARFSKHFEVSAEEALACEGELTRYFILTEAFPDADHGMYGGFVDEFWHTFLVFTLDYVDYCRDVFGTYMHHVPNTEEGKPMGQTEASASGPPSSTYADFARDYEQTFDEPVPEIWQRPAPKPRAVDR